MVMNALILLLSLYIARILALAKFGRTYMYSLTLNPFLVICIENARQELGLDILTQTIKYLHLVYIHVRSTFEI